jgi:hypothetical protein
MSDSVQSQQYAQGQLVLPSDLAGDFEGVRDLVAKSFADVLGSANVLPAMNPLTIALSSSTLSFTVGGAGQSIIALDSASGNPRVIDSPPQQTIAIPTNNSGVWRTDYLWVQYAQIPTNPHVVAFADGTNRTVYDSLEGCRYAYNSTSTAPTGYQLFAVVKVPAGATIGTQCQVTYSMATASQRIQALASFPTNSVTSIKGLIGDVALIGNGGVTVTVAGQTINITGPIATAINGLTNGISLAAADSSITITPSGQTLLFRANFPTTVTTLNGLNGAIAITTPDGSIGIGASGGSVQLSVGSSFSGMTKTAAVILSGTSSSVSLPTLPLGTWDCYVDAWINSSGEAAVTGSGIGAGWALNNPTRGGSAIPYSKHLYATASTGDTPSVTVSGGFTLAGLVKIWAVRR